MAAPVRTLFAAAGAASLFLGALGLFLPVLPTTPFVLLAAFCFSKADTRLHGWLLANPVFGPIVRDWEERGAVKTSAKVTATVLMALLAAVMLATGAAAPWLKGAAVLTQAAVLAFLWTRPSR